MNQTGSLGIIGAPVITLPRRRASSPTETVIRPFSGADVESVATLWRESAIEWPGGGPFGGRHATAEGVRHEQRARHPLETFIAWRRDPASGSEIAVGFCSLLAQPDDATATYVGLLTAHPAWHGQGIGRDLLMAAISRTVEIGRDRVDLHTWSGNLKAVPLYKKVGFFWVPDTSVRMANYLPMLMRIDAVRAYFDDTGADWYADAARTLDLAPDRANRGLAEVFEYAWERDGLRLSASIDRHSNALVALSTPQMAIGLSIDDPRIPTGTKRTATFQLSVADATHGSASPAHEAKRSVTATFVATGRGAVRTTCQAHRIVGAGATADVEWSVEGVLSGPKANPRPGMASPDLVHVLAVIDDKPISFACAARVVPPVTLSMDDFSPLRPGQNRAASVTAENETDEQATATIRATATGPFVVEMGDQTTVNLRARARIAIPVHLRATGSGSGTLHLTGTVGDTPASVAVPLHAGDAGAIFVDQTDAHVRVTTDDLVVTAALANSGWQPTFTVADRHTSHALLRHSCGLGPPFSPSPISASTWVPTVTHHAGAVSVVLRATPTDLPGVIFERHLRIAGSGVIDVHYLLVNGTDAPLTFDVGTGTSAELDGSRSTRIACVVDGVVVDDESDAFPDWDTPSGGASRLTEGWIAEYGDGMVVGAIWTDATDVHGDGRLAELVLPLGTVASGASAKTATVRLYAGPGDWKAVRTRWQAYGNVDQARFFLPSPSATYRSASPARPGPAPRSKTSPAAHERETEAGGTNRAGDGGRPPDDEQRVGVPRRVDIAALGAPFTVDDVHTTDLVLSRANDTPISGSVSVITGNYSTSVTEISISALSPATAHVSIPMPSARPGAVTAVARLASIETTTDLPLALVRVGRRGETVTTSVGGTPSPLSVTLDTGSMRVRLLPTQRARIVAIETPGTDGRWIDHLLSSEPEPRPWVWFNPWYGGISVHFRESGWHTGQTPLDRATWTWRTTSADRGGIRWHGITSTAVIEAPDGLIWSSDAVERARLAGVSVEVAYLVAGGGTAIAIEATVHNGSASRLRGTISIPTYWKPGGTTDGTTIYYDRRGPRSRRRAHGAHWSATEGWVAIVDATGTAVPVVVTADPDIILMGGDMGLNGVHPFAWVPVDLDPQSTRCLRLWVSVASDLDEARAWRSVVGTSLPPHVPPLPFGGGGAEVVGI